MQSTKVPPQQTQQTPTITLAQKWKQQGNSHYQQFNYQKAIQCYTKAIELNPNDVFYFSNRAACNLNLKKYQQVLYDSNKALALDPKLSKGYRRKALACMNLGLFDQAIMSFKEYLSTNKDTLIEQDCQATILMSHDLKLSLEHLQNNNYKEALKFITFVTNRIDHYSLVKIKCEVQARLGETKLAKKSLKKIEKSLSKAEILYLKAIIEMNLYGTTRVKKYLEMALEIEEGNQKVKQLLNNVEVGEGKYLYGIDLVSEQLYDEAIKQFQSALLVEPANRILNSRICLKISECLMHQNNKQKAEEYLNKSIELNPLNTQSYLKRIELLVLNKEHQKAIADYKKLQNIDTKTNYKQRIKDLQTSNTRKDYYQILEVPRDSTLQHIQKTYKQNVLKSGYHLEKGSDGKSKLDNFDEIAEAYEVLVSPQSKQLYDSDKYFESKKQVNLATFYETDKRCKKRGFLEIFKEKKKGLNPL